MNRSRYLITKQLRKRAPRSRKPPIEMGFTVSLNGVVIPEVVSFQALQHPDGRDTVTLTAYANSIEVTHVELPPLNSIRKKRA